MFTVINGGVKGGGNGGVGGGGGGGKEIIFSYSMMSCKCENHNTNLL